MKGKWFMFGDASGRNNMEQGRADSVLDLLFQERRGISLAASIDHEAIGLLHSGPWPRSGHTVAALVDKVSLLLELDGSLADGELVGYKNSIRQPCRSGRWLNTERHDSIAAMLASLLYMVLRRLLTLVAPKHRSGDAAELEILVLRHQLQVLRRQVKRPAYGHWDRALLAAASRILPRRRWGAFLVRPETLLRWHRSLVARKWTRPHRPPEQMTGHRLSVSYCGLFHVTPPPARLPTLIGRAIG